MNLRYVLKGGGNVIFGNFSDELTFVYNDKLYSCSESKLDKNKKYKYFEGVYKEDGYSTLSQVKEPSEASTQYLCTYKSKITSKFIQKFYKKYTLSPALSFQPSSPKTTASDTQKCPMCTFVNNKGKKRCDICRSRIIN